MGAGEVKEDFRETLGLTGLITDGHFEPISEWKNPQHRNFKDDHDSAAGDYVPIQRVKRTLIEVKQLKETLVQIHGVQDKADHNQQ